MTEQRLIWLKKYVRAKVPYYLHDWSDDITQDIMIRLLRADQRKGAVVSNYGYLKQTAMSVMIDYIRKYKAKRSLEDDLGEDDLGGADLPMTAIDSGQESPESWTENQWLLDQVYRVISSFSKEKQNTLLLYLRGLKIKDIATLTGCGLSKVRNDVYRGKNEIIKQLNAQGISYEV